MLIELLLVFAFCWIVILLPNLSISALYCLLTKYTKDEHQV